MQKIAFKIYACTSAMAQEFSHNQGNCHLQNFCALYQEIIGNFTP